MTHVRIDHCADERWQPTLRLRLIRDRLASADRIAAFCVASCRAAAAVARQLRRAVAVVDEARARAAGIRKLTGKHLVLYTDVPSEPGGRPPAGRLRSGRAAVGRVLRRRHGKDSQLASAGLSHRRPPPVRSARPDAAPATTNFTNGISIGREFWLYDQPTRLLPAPPDAARRHARVHGRRSSAAADRAGTWKAPPSCSARTASTSDTGQLTLRIMPQSRDEVPMLGPHQVDPTTPSPTDACSTLPPCMKSTIASSSATKPTPGAGRRPSFSIRIRATATAFANCANNVPRPELQRSLPPNLRRRLGRSAGRVAGVHRDARPRLRLRAHGDRLSAAASRSTDGRAPSTIAADRGWQSSGVRLEAGKSYRVTATGRYEIAERRRKPWPCEPGGVTIDYHDGRPLGMLLGAIDGTNATATTLADPFAIGLGTTIKPTASGTLYLRVNDSPANSTTIAARSPSTISTVPS